MGKRILTVCAIALLAACELDPFLFNSKQADAYMLPGNAIPDSLIQEVAFQSGPYTLYGIWVASDGGRPGLTLLYCHGNKHGIDEYWDRIQVLHELGTNIFIFDYRGYGKSGGESTEKGLYEDGRAALELLRDEFGIRQDSLIIYGYSLGNVVSIDLAAGQITPLCLFAESPFASATSLAQGSTGLDIPHRWLTKGEYNNADRIKKIQSPFCLLHGTDDDFVRWKDNGRVVFDNAPEPKNLVLVPGADHTNVWETMGEEAYLKAIGSWIGESIKGDW
ncbi:alpha/beta hydrolase [bacterium]|nr:alpha/beta hydrolase [bacterium]